MAAAPRGGRRIVQRSHARMDASPLSQDGLFLSIPGLHRQTSAAKLCQVSPNPHARLTTKALSNTIETYFQIFSTKYDKFQPNIQIFDYSISCLVSHINHWLDTNKPKKDLIRANGSYSDVHDVKEIDWKLCFSRKYLLSDDFSYPKSVK